jgi:hypothetical protein
VTNSKKTEDVIKIINLINSFMGIPKAYFYIIYYICSIDNHTLSVQRGLNMDIALFIVSEALFFFSYFLRVFS